ncbi:MAG: phosphoribosylformylglycinamidine synthase subunit PurQ [Phycisphaerae bacterium]
MTPIRVLILRAAGTNCDLETQHAWELAGARAERIHLRRLIEQPRMLDAYQIVTLPGGFSYGDDIAAGRIFAAQLRRHLLDQLRTFIEAGKLVLGICNGFQILVKAGLLPYPHEIEGEASSVGRRAVCTVTYNEPAGFQDRWVRLRAGDSPCVFTEPGRTYEMPIAHAEGRVVFADRESLERVIDSGQNAISYVPAGTQAGTATDRKRGHSDSLAKQAGNGRPAGGKSECPLFLPSAGKSPAGREVPHNPNRSDADIAGLCDPTGRVVGLMPHPARFVTWPQHPCWTSQPARETGDGLALFQRAAAYFA